MRSLKFRAWEIEDKKYYPVIKLWFDSQVGKPDSAELWLSQNATEIADIPEQIELEQYTGLKDKNGKEIYEGDIIIVGSHGLTPYVVIYREGDCSFVCNNEFIVDYVHLFKGMPQCYEVIGNIHENPELLEQGNAKD